MLLAEMFGTIEYELYKNIEMSESHRIYRVSNVPCVT